MAKLFDDFAVSILSVAEVTDTYKVLYTSIGASMQRINEEVVVGPMQRFALDEIIFTGCGAKMQIVVDHPPATLTYSQVPSLCVASDVSFQRLSSSSWMCLAVCSLRFAWFAKDICSHTQGYK